MECLLTRNTLWRVIFVNLKHTTTLFALKELLILRDSHYVRMCFKSVKTLWKKPRPSAKAFSTAKNVELFGYYPIQRAEAL